MLGLGSGISSMISTLIPLVLYEAAGLMHMQSLRSEGCQLAWIDHRAQQTLECNLCVLTSAAASYCSSGTSVEIILDIPDPNPNINHYPAVLDKLHVHARW